MGYNTAGYSLISMANGDVYYISADSVAALIFCTENQQPYFKTKDVKSGADIVVNVSQISSIVVKGASDGKRY